MNKIKVEVESVIVGKKIHDLEQLVKDWIDEEVIKNFLNHIKNGGEPKLDIKIGKIMIKIRLVE
jgi:hypothetical protein